MISIIICSTNEERLDRVCQNISDTIGVEHEFLIRHNGVKSDGICKVYNELAAQASFGTLCFVHEDVAFLTPNWGVIIGGKVCEPKTGIVGVVGCAIKTKSLSGIMHKHYAESSAVDGVEGQELPIGRINTSTSGLEFAPVVIVDGLLLVMRKDVWSEVKFDEVTFPNFHLYDLDISTAVTVAGYTNYVCHLVDVVHYSRGSYSVDWYTDSIKYNSKWAGVLPLYINRPSDKQIKKDEKYIFFNITYHLIKRRALPPAMITGRIYEQLRRYPFNFKSYYQAYRYLRYMVEYKNK